MLNILSFFLIADDFNECLKAYERFDAQYFELFLNKLIVEHNGELVAKVSMLNILSFFLIFNSRSRSRG